MVAVLEGLTSDRFGGRRIIRRWFLIAGDGKEWGASSADAKARWWAAPSIVYVAVGSRLNKNKTAVVGWTWRLVTFTGKHSNRNHNVACFVNIDTKYIGSRVHRELGGESSR